MVREVGIVNRAHGRTETLGTIYALWVILPALLFALLLWKLGGTGSTRGIAAEIGIAVLIASAVVATCSIVALWTADRRTPWLNYAAGLLLILVAGANIGVGLLVKSDVQAVSGTIVFAVFMWVAIFVTLVSLQLIRMTWRRK
ncbi:hypothetical protein ACFVAV_17080 [Nocardia sp. NPDC057663]|uniref:hypothetical protein n=1 Tax=Nocardia sp. NPDC057663 TaxID=3346201 RepID=UPI003672AA8B